MSSNELENKIKEVAKQYLGKPIALSGGIDSGLLAALIKPKFVAKAFYKICPHQINILENKDE